MKRLEETLRGITAANGKKKSSLPALMTHVVLGYPTLEKSIEIVRAMDDAGASIIEIQIPFSDPMADGPTIMAANEHALANGIRVRDSFNAVEQLSKTVKAPILFMSYYNILFRYSATKKRRNPSGVADFCRDAAACGVEGLIVPDVPASEHEEYWKIAKNGSLAAIPIVTPVSTDSRLKAIRGLDSDGFVYCVTTTGTTGARKELPKDVPAYLERVRKYFSQPLAVGFGISSRKQVEALSGVAEIAIVGSAVVDVITKSGPKHCVKQVAAFVRTLTG